MRNTIFFLLIVLFSSLVWAGDNFVAPNVKTGLWEVTETHSMTGMPPMPAMPPEALARMSPEQRAQMEAHMKESFGGAPKTTIRKDCITKEDLDKNRLFQNDRKECTRTVVSSSATSTEVKFHCVEKEMTSDGTAKFQALTPESVKGTVHMAMTGHDRTMNMNIEFVSKYLGPACGDVK